MTEETKPAETKAATTTDAPKVFAIRCAKCCWARLSTGLAADLADLSEAKSNCAGCGKARAFYCPRCGAKAKMNRFRGNT